MTVTAYVYQSSVPLLFTTHLLELDDRYARILKKVMTGQVLKMKIISAMVDKINEDDVKDAAMKEGNDSRKTSQATYFESMDVIIENQKDQTGVAEWGIEPNSKEQHQLVSCLDYEDLLWPGAGCFNLCTHCGRAFGGKLWWNRDIGSGFTREKLSHLDVAHEAFTQKTSKAKSGQCHYRCLVEWKQLEQAKTPK